MLLLDVKNKGLIEANHHFNASIIRLEDRVFMAYRANNNKLDCRIAIVELSEEKDTFVPIGPNYELKFPTVYQPDQHLFEDPRLFVYQNTLFVAFTNVNLENGCQCQGIAPLTENFTVANSWYISYGDNINGAITPKFQRVDGKCIAHVEFPVLLEKNWVFFEHNDALNFIYQATPNHVVAAARDYQVTDVYETPNTILWPYGQIRGGTPPIRFDDNYFITFFHSSFDPEISNCRTGGFNGRVYTMGAYLFKSEPPYEIEYITQRPLLTGDVYGTKALWKHAVCFPCGTFSFDNHYYVSYGLNDHKIKVMKIHHNELINEFVKLPKQKQDYASKTSKSNR